jgi:hypothetical protein
MKQNGFFFKSEDNNRDNAPKLYNDYTFSNLKLTVFGIVTQCVPQRAGPASPDILLGLHFDPECRGDMFLRNAELPPNYAELNHTLHSHRCENVNSRI